MSTARETFTARFGEDQATAIEAAARQHFDSNSTFGGSHDGDNLGSEPFKYWFLLAIGHECVSRPAFREEHGVTADVDAMKEWSLGEGDLASHDGDIPDYLALICGGYEGWLPVGGSDEARWTPDQLEESQP